MKNLTKAIELAKQGGYEPVFKEPTLDPKFWIALGKSLGWFHEDGRPVAKYYNNDPKRTSYPLHLWHWHSLIDHLAAEKSLDDFFKDLIVNK